MTTKKIKIRGLTKHKMHILNENFDNRVKLKKVSKSHKHKDYYTY